MDIFFAALPKLLFNSLPALPLVSGLVAAERHWRAGQLSAYLRTLLGSIVAGAIVLWLLWGTFFGNDLSGSSTAGVALILAPIFAAIAQWGFMGIWVVALGKAEVPEILWLPARWLMAVPVGMFSILMTGIIHISF
jgi:hypothetical protein